MSKKAKEKSREAKEKSEEAGEKNKEAKEKSNYAAEHSKVGRHAKYLRAGLCGGGCADEARGGEVERLHGAHHSDTGDQRGREVGEDAVGENEARHELLLHRVVRGKLSTHAHAY
eukprot:6188549-Pleurochrysis_carterae.AAC.1